MLLLKSVGHRQVTPWLLAGAVLDSPKSNSWTTHLNSQMVYPCQLGVLTLLHYLFWCFIFCWPWKAPLQKWSIKTFLYLSVALLMYCTIWIACNITLVLWPWVHLGIPYESALPFLLSVPSGGNKNTTLKRTEWTQTQLWKVLRKSNQRVFTLRSDAISYVFHTLFNPSLSSSKCWTWKLSPQNLLQSTFLPQQVIHHSLILSSGL